MKDIFVFFLCLVVCSCSSCSQNSSNNYLIDTNNVRQNRNGYILKPEDESGVDSSLKKFIGNLKMIAKNKDTSSLYNILDSSIVISNGGALIGKGEFINYWKLSTDVNSSILWPYLLTILNMGGAWEKNENWNDYIIPYVQSTKALEPYDLEWYTTGVCISYDVSIFDRIGNNAKIVGRLSYNIVEVDRSFHSPFFCKIKTIDGKIKGYVKTEDIYFFANPSLLLRKKNEGWKIIEFAPYD